MKHFRLHLSSLLWKFGSLVLTVAHELERPWTCSGCAQRECACAPITVGLVIDGRRVGESVRRFG